jgi:hypothetical protein
MATFVVKYLTSMKKLILSLIAIAGFAVMGLAQTAQTATPGGGTQSVISFTSDKHDFGTVPQGIPVTYAFSFVNTGKEPLFIKNATGSCGCTVPEYTQEAIAPGGKGTVKVTYNAAALGPINRTVTITTNSATTPVIVLSIGGEVKATAVATTAASETKPASTAKPTKN